MCKEYDAVDFLTSSDSSDFLGRGSYASVRRCRHNELGNVVVKCFLVTGSDVGIDEKLQHMQNEAKVLCRIEHENIIKVFGITKWSTCYGLVMEEAAGYNLEDLIIQKTDKVIPWPLRGRFFKDIADGIDYLHNHDPKRAYIHGDLKPQNILLAEGLVLKIADFGAVSIIQASGASSVASFNIASSKQFTWLYSAPELLKKPEANKTRAMDVYSYAMIGYEIIARCQVFVSTNVSHNLIKTLIMENGQKPNSDYVMQVKNEIVDKDDHAICDKLFQVVTQCWCQVSSDRLSIRNAQNFLQSNIVSDNLQEKIKSFKRGRKQLTLSSRRATLTDFEFPFQRATKLRTRNQFEYEDLPQTKSYSKENVTNGYFPNVFRASKHSEKSNRAKESMLPGKKISSSKKLKKKTGKTNISCENDPHPYSSSDSLSTEEGFVKPRFLSQRYPPIEKHQDVNRRSFHESKKKKTFSLFHRRFSHPRRASRSSSGSGKTLNSHSNVLSQKSDDSEKHQEDQNLDSSFVENTDKHTMNAPKPQPFLTDNQLLSPYNKQPLVGNPPGSVVQSSGLSPQLAGFSGTTSEATDSFFTRKFKSFRQAFKRAFNTNKSEEYSLLNATSNPKTVEIQRFSQASADSHLSPRFEHLIADLSQLVSYEDSQKLYHNCSEQSGITQFLFLQKAQNDCKTPSEYFLQICSELLKILGERFNEELLLNHFRSEHGDATIADLIENYKGQETGREALI